MLREELERDLKKESGNRRFHNEKGEQVHCPSNQLSGSIVFHSMGGLENSYQVDFF